MTYLICWAIIAVGLYLVARTCEVGGVMTAAVCLFWSMSLLAGVAISHAMIATRNFAEDDPEEAAP